MSDALPLARSRAERASSQELEPEMEVATDSDDETSASDDQAEAA